VNVVQIEASDVIFGELQKGFTLTGAVFGVEAAGSGLVILAGTSGVQVGGNLATRNDGTGFDVEGGSGHHVRGNTASANGTRGFEILGSGHHVRGNTASANGNLGGFVILGNGHHVRGNMAIANGLVGFSLDGSGHVLNGNVATANEFDGFFIGPPGGDVLTGNMAIANGSAGFEIGNSGGSVLTGNVVLTGNAALGNKDAGILIGSDGSATITQNNIFGNDSPPSTNCGLDNLSGGAINATDNFWGTAHGPGTLTTPQPEPADNVCDDTTNHPGSSTSVAPFATKKFTVETPLVEPGL